MSDSALDRTTNLDGATNQLFEERTPEAAAIQLAMVLAWATECELATLEDLKLRKSATKYDTRRHQSIADKLVFNCIDLKVPPRGFWGRPCGRLEKAMREPKEIILARMRLSEA